MPKHSIHVPFVNLSRQYLSLRYEILTEFDQIGKSGNYILGEKLELFEREAARFCETKYALGVANGSDALFLILKGLGIGVGDEVITCPNSFIASAGAIVATGARPVFVDVREDYNIDPERIAAAITSRTKAIMPVHLTGRPADMDAVNSIAAFHRIHVVEDSAQAIGARYKEKRTGSLGLASGFSLHPLKNLGVYGDGGLITTDATDLYHALVRLRNHGLRNRDECDMWGFNSRLDSMQAAFALIKLNHLEQWNKSCREIAARYRDGLNSFVWVPTDKDYEECVYHNFVIRTDKRDDLMVFLAKEGVDTRIHYPIPIHLQESSLQLGYKMGDFPVTEKFAKRMLSLPIYPELTETEINHVVSSVKRFFQ